MPVVIGWDMSLPMITAPMLINMPRELPPMPPIARVSPTKRGDKPVASLHFEDWQRAEINLHLRPSTAAGLMAGLARFFEYLHDEDEHRDDEVY